MSGLFIVCFLGLAVAGIYEMYREKGDWLCGLCILLSNLVLLWMFI
jgi:hypothetical protein